MKCPLFVMNKSTNSDCLEAECGWYHRLDLTEGQCALITIAVGMSNVDDSIEELDKKLSVIVDYLKPRRKYR
jgi:hypothetical protein